jgi:hypothetical protein
MLSIVDRSYEGILLFCFAILWGTTAYIILFFLHNFLDFMFSFGMNLFLIFLLFILVLILVVSLRSHFDLVEIVLILIKYRICHFKKEFLMLKLFNFDISLLNVVLLTVPFVFIFLSYFIVLPFLFHYEYEIQTSRQNIKNEYSIFLTFSINIKRNKQ